MKLDRLAIPLALANLALLAALVAQGTGTNAAAPAAVLRAERIELVDPRGIVRGELRMEEDGEVVFRLRDDQGNIRVKLAASALGSGLLLADDTAEPGVHILSGISRLTHQRSTMITLADPGGARREIRPGAAGAEP